MGQSIGTLFPLTWRLWLGKRLFKPLGPKTFRVSWHRVIKGPCDPPEVEAMQYVASHTKIPVPSVYGVHTHRNHHTEKTLIYIEMAYVPGDDLETAWGPKGGLTMDEKKTIFAEIKQHMSELRELRPPKEDLVSSALQNPAYDGRIGFRFFGPLNHQDFHSLTRGHLRMDDVAQFLGTEVHHVHNAHYRTVFTHADLAARNIIVKNGGVAAIIDWAYSGWYPEYWEFTKANYDSLPFEDWDEHLREALPCYDLELTAEQTLWTMLPDPGTPTTVSRDGVRYESEGSKPSTTWVNARASRQLTDLWSLVSF